ncbi:MAG: PIN domain-containing protein [Candidatus Thorarchaeota archaeon]
MHSIGVILFSRKIGRRVIYSKFIEDVIISGGIRVLPLSHLDGDLIVESAEKFDMDFDDAYQYAICKKYDLDIVTFNKRDFDGTDLTVITP